MFRCFYIETRELLETSEHFHHYCLVGGLHQLLPQQSVTRRHRALESSVGLAGTISYGTSTYIVEGSDEKSDQE